MEGPERVVHNTEDIRKIATNYYKNLFKFEDRPDIRINDDFFEEEDKVSLEETAILEAPFSEEEVKKAIF
jgi:hypothetical protein